jgi:prepilin-type processing-associated H-X9-DG protein
MSADVEEKPPRRRGCTCLEAAVALAVVLILAAVLFPWNRPPSSHTPGCQSHLKQISLAFLMYTQDHADMGPPAAVWPEGLDPYLKARQLYVCPKAPKLPIGYAYGEHIPVRPLGALTHPEAVLTFWDATPGAETFAFRHNGGLNTAYADGHVKRLASERLYEVLLEGYGRGLTVGEQAPRD